MHREMNIKSQWEGKSGAETTEMDRKKTQRTFGQKWRQKETGENKLSLNNQTFSAMPLYHVTQRHFVKAFHKTSSILNQVYALLSFF